MALGLSPTKIFGHNNKTKSSLKQPRTSVPQLTQTCYQLLGLSCWQVQDKPQECQLCLHNLQQYWKVEYAHSPTHAPQVCCHQHTAGEQPISSYCSAAGKCRVSQWGKWGKCMSVSDKTRACAEGSLKGVTLRSRSVIFPGDKHAHCPVLHQARACTLPPCFVDCKLSGWSAWSICDLACQRRRQRKVIVHSTEGGRPCPAQQEQAKPCHHCSKVKSALRRCFADLRRILAIAPTACHQHELSITQLPSCSAAMKQYYCAHFGRPAAPAMAAAAAVPGVSAAGKPTARTSDNSRQAG